LPHPSSFNLACGIRASILQLLCRFSHAFDFCPENEAS